MKHFGDITKLSGYKLPLVDVITGGSPCQDLSVAGKRAGLAGERSGLFMEQIRIVKEMRERDKADGRKDELIRPRYMVWENVPGAFSSNKGEDFRAVLEETAKICDKNTIIPKPENGKWTPSGCIMGNGWSIAWRVHDAQFWGVPQRRKRIALVADFGGLSAPEILFERKGLSRDSEQSGTAREETAGAAGGSVEGASSGVVTKGNGDCFLTPERHTSLATGGGQAGQGYPCVLDERGASGTISFQERGGKPGGGKGILIQHEHVGALSTQNNQSVLHTREPILLESNQNHATVQTDGISTALPASMGMGGGYVPMVTAYGIGGYNSKGMLSPNPHSGIYEADTARTLDLNGGSPACNQGGIAVVHSVGCDVYNQEITGDVAASLTAASGGSNTSGPKVIAGQETAVYDARGNGDGKTVCTITGDHQNRVTDYTAVCVGNGQMCNITMKPLANTLDTMHDQQAVLTTVGALCARDYKGVGNQYVEEGKVIPQNAIVRRLTPLECERLQGYPDGWTDIGEWVDSKGKKHKEADSPRYKALGNSIALPFWEWMAQRIVKYLGEKPTMASLFDGIGGFPLVFERCGAKAVWASEIEEFPIAVTKRNFP